MKKLFKFFILAFNLIFIVIPIFSQEVVECSPGSRKYCGIQNVSLLFNCSSVTIVSDPTGTFSTATESSQTTVVGTTSNTDATIWLKVGTLNHDFYIYSRQKPNPSISTNPAIVCEGSSFTIICNVTPAPGTFSYNYAWNSPESIISNGAQKDITAASTLYSGYYTVTVNNSDMPTCSTTVSKNITIRTVPSILSTTPASICVNGTATLQASASAGTITWYASDGTPLSGPVTGNSYTTPSLSSTTTYLVDATSNGCTSSKASITATVNPSSSITSTTQGSRCGAGTVNLQANASTGIINWYSAATGGTLLGTGVSFLTPSISATTSYYAEAISNNCSSARSEVIATVNTIPVLNPCTNISLCDAGNASLSASFVSGTGTGATINWFTTPVGGTSLSSANPFSVTVPSTNTFYAEASNANCTSPNRTPLTVTVSPKPIVQYSFTKSSGCTPATNVTGINLTPDATGYTYSWTPSSLSGQNVSCLAENSNYKVMVTNTANNCFTDLDIAVRKKFRTILVLDRTGSMGSKPSGYTFSKWELLKSDIDVLTAMINLNHLTAIPPDDIATMGYNSTQTVYSEAGNNFLPVFESIPTTTSIDAFMGSLSPTGVTSIGGALKKAIDLAGALNSNETVNILLVTDGMQNTNPMVDLSTGEIKDGSGTVYYDLDNINSNIKIYCLGIGNMNISAHNLLTTIASKGHGVYYSAFEPDDVSTSITEFYSDMYSGSSPKLVRFYNEKLESTKPVSKEFLVNTADKINFVLSYLPGEDKDFSLKKGDVDIPLSIISGNNYKMATLIFPLKVNGKKIGSAGTWIMNIRGSKVKTAYKAFAIADVHKLECSFKAIKKGKSIALTVSIPDAKKYLKNIKVTARLFKPTADAGDVFSNYSVSNYKTNLKNIYTKDASAINRYKLSNTDYNNLTDAQAKWDLLTVNNKTNKILTPKSDSVKTLAAINDNAFASLTNSNISGTYKVCFVVEATTVDNEPFYRTATREINIYHESIDIAASNIVFVDNNPLKDIIVVKPINDMGHVVLPNVDNTINVNLGGVKPEQIINNLDGSYTFYFKKGLINTPDNILKIDQGTKPIYEKKIKDIKKTVLPKKEKDLILKKSITDSKVISPGD